jgi:hypothetical protein
MSSNVIVYANQYQQAIKDFKQDGYTVFKIEGTTLSYKNDKEEVFKAEAVMSEHGLKWVDIVPQTSAEEMKSA